MEWPKAVKPRQTPREVFIRFGRWSSCSYNACTGDKEKGVSVYPAILEDGVVRLEGSDFDIPGQVLAGRCVFAVTGTVNGMGSDGEPVLRGVRALPYAIDPGSMPVGFKKAGYVPR